MRGVDGAAVGVRFIILYVAAGDVDEAGCHEHGAAVLGGVAMVLLTDIAAADGDGLATGVVERAAFHRGVVTDRAAADLHGAGRCIDGAALLGRAAFDDAALHADGTFIAIDGAAVAVAHRVFQDGRRGRHGGWGGCGRGGFHAGIRVSGGAGSQISHADAAAKGQGSLVVDHSGAEDTVAVQNDVAQRKRAQVVDHRRRHVALACDGGFPAASAGPTIVVGRGQGDVQIGGDHRRVAGGHQVIRQHFDGPFHVRSVIRDIRYSAGQRMEFEGADAANLLGSVGQLQLRVVAQGKVDRAVVSHGFLSLRGTDDGFCA